MNSFVRSQRPIPIPMDPARDPIPMANRNPSRADLTNFPAWLRQDRLAQRSDMTLAEFVKSKFVPERVMAMRLAGRAHYQALLKHIVPPADVDRMFQVDSEKSSGKLKVLPDWPYLGNLRLDDVGPDQIERLIVAAVNRGYSTQTVLHIRNVVSAIFLHAHRVNLFSGSNPAKIVTLPKLTHRNTRLLSHAQAKEVLALMRYPEREIALMAMLTKMNIAEICGLQWKHLNLTGVWSSVDGEPIPPLTIAVRRRWYRGEMDNVKPGRKRNFPIPALLLPMLLRASGRRMYSGPNDFVLVSKAGTPVNPNNIAERRLRLIGVELQIPGLSWNVFRHAGMNSESEFETELHFLLATRAYSGLLQDIVTVQPIG